MKTVTHLSSFITVATLAISTLFLATNVVAEEVVKPSENAKVLPLADFIKKLSVTNDSNVNGSNDVYLKSSRSGNLYKIYIKKGVVWYESVNGGSAADQAIIIPGKGDPDTLCFEFSNRKIGDTCLRYLEDGNDYYVEMTNINFFTKVVTKRFDKKPDPKVFGSVK